MTSWFLLFRWLEVLLLCLFLSMSAGTSAAQQTDTKSQTQTQTQAPLVQPVESSPEEEGAPAPISDAEIAGQTTKAVNKARELLELCQPVGEIQQIKEAFPDFIEETTNLLEDPASTHPEDRATVLLAEVRLHWLRISDRMERWSRRLDTRLQKLIEGEQELDYLKQVWQLTAASIAQEEVPEAITENIARVLQGIADVEPRMQERKAELLNLQSQSSELRIAIVEVLSRIELTLEARQNRIFKPDMPPFWRALEGIEDRPSVGDQFGEIYRRLRFGIREFIQNYRVVIYQQLAFLLILTFVIFGINRRAKRLGEEDENLKEATAVLGRPFAAAGIVTLMASSLFYPRAPLVIFDLAAILALPLAARLAPRLLPRSMVRPLYFLLLLSFLISLQNMIIEQGPLRRSLLMLISLLTLWGLVRRRRLLRRSASLIIWPRFSTIVVQLGAPIFFAVIVANILGLISLAEMVAFTTLDATYLAFLILACVRILEALVMVALRTRTAQSLASLRFHAVTVQRWFSRLLRFAAVIAWFAVVLGSMHTKHPVLDLLRGWLIKEWRIGSLQISLANILLFIVVLWIASLISRIVRTLLRDDILPRTALTRGTASTVSMLVNYTILGFGILLALAAAGIRVEQFALIAGALGVGIGFGLQNIVSNFISGLILAFERPIQVGDTVEVGNLMGNVRRIGIRSSTVRTFDGAEVIVPNNDLINFQVVNWTLSDRMRRIEVSVGVAYGTDPHRVLDLLTRVAGEHDKVLDNPGPVSLFRAFGDSSLDFALRFWTGDFANWWQIASEVTVAVNDALKEAGIVIPFPQRDLHVKSIDPPATIRDITPDVAPDNAPADVPDDDPKDIPDDVPDKVLENDPADIDADEGADEPRP